MSTAVQAPQRHETMIRLLLSLCLLSIATSAHASPPCRQPADQVEHGQARLTVRVEGTGRPVLMIPSLGRGMADFDLLARDLVAQGYTGIRYEPRWFGPSTGPTEADLHDLAGDAAAVAAAACPDQSVAVIGHALGNRIARTMAADHPDQVSSIILLAAGGQVPIAPAIEQAILTSASQGLVPDAERLSALATAFFAPGQDASAWLTGWDPQAAQLQARAVRVTQDRDWATAGTVPLLIVQPTMDPVAPVANGRILLERYRGPAVLVTLDHASHAILPEQPAAVSAITLAWMAGEREAARLQAISTENARTP